MTRKSLLVGQPDGTVVIMDRYGLDESYCSGPFSLAVARHLCPDGEFVPPTPPSSVHEETAWADHER